MFMKLESGQRYSLLRRDVVKPIRCLLPLGLLPMLLTVADPHWDKADAEEQPPERMDGSPAWEKGHYPTSITPTANTPFPVYQQLELICRDRTKLIVHQWSPLKTMADRPVVIFLHGIGMHGKPYEAIAAGFTARGLTFIVPDLRGHGRSQGNRSTLPEPQVLRRDLDEVIGLVNRRHAQAPIVLAGESMGGLMAADYACRDDRRLAGLALLAPAFKLNRSQIDFEELRKNLPKWFLEGVPLDNDAKLAVSTRDGGFCKARQTDSLALHKVSPSYLFTILGLQLDWPAAAVKIKLPLFIAVAGKDKIVDVKIIKTVYQDAASAKDVKVWREWCEAFHTMCWDPSTPQVIDDLVTWVLQRSK